MSKDPAILFYTSDFLTGTFTMTNEQVGKYIKLLCLQHQKGKLSTYDMEFVCSGSDPIVFAKFQQDEHGYYFNKTLTEHAEKRKAYSESRKNNRKKSSYDNHMSNICKTYDKHMENENEIENVIVLGTTNKINKRETFFNDFPNSSYLESVCKDLNQTKDQVLSRLKDFRIVSEADYNSMAEFSTHLKRWINKNPAKKMGGMVW